MADDHPARARLRPRPGDRRADRRAPPGHDPAPDAVHERHRRLRARPRRALLGLRVHAEAAGPRLLASTRTAPGDQFLFNLLISPVAIVVNFVASLPRAIRALFAGRLHSRVPATILIAIGGFLASGGDALNRFGVTNYFQVGKFLAVLFLFAGFLVSIEAFREIRIPFTTVVLRRRRHEPEGGRRPPPRGCADRPPVAAAGCPADASGVTVRRRAVRPVPCPGARPEAAARLPDRRRRRERLRHARPARPVRLRRRLRSAVVRRLAGDVRPALRPRRDLGVAAAARRRRSSDPRRLPPSRPDRAWSRSPRRRSASTSRCSSPSI